MGWSARFHRNGNHQPQQWLALSMKSLNLKVTSAPETSVLVSVSPIYQGTAQTMLTFAEGWVLIFAILSLIGFN